MHLPDQHPIGRGPAPRHLIRILLTALSAGTLFAQTSEISGRILDASKGALASVKITLTRSDTGLRRTTLSSEEGYYHLPLLSAGSYEIKAEREGFQSRTHTGIIVETGVNSVIDLQLELGAVAETVNVTESAPLLQTGTSAISQVVENKTIAGMPLLDRRSAQLTRLNGFVVAGGRRFGCYVCDRGRTGQQRELSDRWRKCPKPEPGSCHAAVRSTGGSDAGVQRGDQ